MPKPESKFWSEIKKKKMPIQWTRLESWASAGVPDLLGYNKNHFYFTVELKVTAGNKLCFSPHQIAYHKTHPLNSFILAKSLGPCAIKLYEGGQIEGLLEQGLELDALCLGLDACSLFFSELGAWSLEPGA